MLHLHQGIADESGFPPLSFIVSRYFVYFPPTSPYLCNLVVFSQIEFFHAAVLGSFVLHLRAFRMVVLIRLCLV